MEKVNQEDSQILNDAQRSTHIENQHETQNLSNIISNDDDDEDDDEKDQENEIYDPNTSSFKRVKNKFFTLLKKVNLN